MLPYTPKLQQRQRDKGLPAGRDKDKRVKKIIKNNATTARGHNT